MLRGTAMDRATTLTVALLMVIAEVGDIITIRITIGFTGKQAAMKSIQSTSVTIGGFL